MDDFKIDLTNLGLPDAEGEGEWQQALAALEGRHKLVAKFHILGNKASFGISIDVQPCLSG